MRVQTETISTTTATTNSEIPAKLESISGIRFLGFMIHNAMEIVANFEEQNDPFIGRSDDIMDYVYSYVSIVKTPAAMNLARDKAMDLIGLRFDVIDALIDPDYRDLFLSQSLYYWICDTIDNNYNALLRLQEQQRVSHEDGPSVAMIDLVATVNIKDSHLPKPYTAISNGSRPERDHAVLYHSTVCKPKHLEWLTEHGHINMDAFARRALKGASVYEDVLYFTPQKKVAERYREWASLRSPRADTCIIRIQLNEPLFINRLRTVKLLSRIRGHGNHITYGQGLENSLTDLFDKGHMSEDVELMISHISTRRHKRKSTVGDDRVQWSSRYFKHVKFWKRLWKRRAVQWAFVGQEVRQRMAQMMMHGKVHVDIFHALDD